MIKGLLKGIAYTAGFVVLGGIGVSIVAAIEHADYDVEQASLYTDENQREYRRMIIMIKLRILNETGHTDLMLEASGIIEQIDSHPTHWAFIDGEMVAREEIANINWDEVTSVDLTPAIVGGNL